MNNQIEWRRAFIRSGFNPIEADGKFDFNSENHGIQLFLHSILSELPPVGEYRSGVFSPSAPTVDETNWLAAIEKVRGGSEGGHADMERFQIEIMDTYMAGIVRWVNAAGIRTTHSCDGHPPYERHGPRIMLANENQKTPLTYFLRVVSDGEWIFRGHSSLCKSSDLRRSRDGEQVNPDRAWLLDVAEAIHRHQAPLHQLVEISDELARK